MGSFVYAQEWQEVKGDHFIVFHGKDYKDFAEQVSRKAEEYYKSISSDLGYVRYSGFWKWENRVKIYIYPDHASYIKASGRPEWSRGVADYYKKHILSYLWSENFLEVLLAHELAHLIFRDFVGFKGEVPLWLDEGVAQWEEKKYREARKRTIREAANKSDIFSLKDLMTIDTRKIQSNDNVKVRGIDGKYRSFKGEVFVQSYYLQAFSLVGFLIEKHHADKFVIFCRQLRDGKSIAQTIQYVYPTQMRTLDEMEKQWVEYKKNYPPFVPFTMTSEQRLSLGNKLYNGFYKTTYNPRR